MARLMDGKAIARKVRQEVRAEVGRLSAGGRKISFAIVVVGSDPASAAYVRSKIAMARRVGMEAKKIALPKGASEALLLQQVASLSADDRISGVIVQLPLPAGIDLQRVREGIDPKKDVDGFHPINVGRLAAGVNRALCPCTPQGVMRLLDESGIHLAGMRAIVVGRSHLVGRPMAQMLLARDSTVTIAHSHTLKLADEVGRSDIVVAAVGRRALIKGTWIKPGAVVIDVGTNWAEGRIQGDVEFEEARKRASAITPVPGGVGPMTVAMLLRNVVKAAKANQSSIA